MEVVSEGRDPLDATVYGRYCKENGSHYIRKRDEKAKQPGTYHTRCPKCRTKHILEKKERQQEREERRPARHLKKSRLPPTIEHAPKMGNFVTPQTPSQDFLFNDIGSQPNLPTEDAGASSRPFMSASTDVTQHTPRRSHTGPSRYMVMEQLEVHGGRLGFLICVI